MRARGRISSFAACVDAESGRESPGRARGNPGSVAASGVSSHPACGRRPLPARWWLLRVQRCRSTGGPTMKILIALLAWCVLFVLCFPLALLALVLWLLAWLVLLPFLLVGFSFAALFAFLSAVLLLHARLLGRTHSAQERALRHRVSATG